MAPEVPPEAAAAPAPDSSAPAQPAPEQPEVIDVEVLEPTMEVTHAYETYTLTLAVYRCALPSRQEARAAHVAAVAWVSPDEFGQYVFPGADQHTVDALVGAMDS